MSLTQTGHTLPAPSVKHAPRRDPRAVARMLLPAFSLLIVLLAIDYFNPRAISYFGLNLMLNLAVPVALATMAQLCVITVNDLDLSIGAYVGFIACVTATLLGSAPLLGAAVILGSIYLAHATNLLTGTLTLLTAVGYVAIYTPLKQVSAINTFIGAFPGAMPPLIGWTAARGLIEWPGVALFAILFLWQFPHFMAIGWMYREDFARAGIRITPTIANTRYAARSTVAQALFYAALMVPVSLWPFALGTDGVAYAVAAAALSLGYLWCTIRFARIVSCPDAHEADAPSVCQPARDLLHASIIYLPLLLAAMMLDARGRLLF